jgi:hypothetical protein
VVQIRLFGDPNEAGSEAPTLSISVNVRFESPSMNVGREAPYDVIPDFVEGIAFGDALGVGFRCLSTSWWVVTALSPSPQLREAVRVQRTCKSTRRLTYPCPDLGNRTFPTRGCSICSRADARSSDPDLTVQGIRRGCALVRRTRYFWWFLGDCSSPSSRFPAWSLGRDGCRSHQSNLFLRRHSTYRIYSTPSDGFKCFS